MKYWNLILKILLVTSIFYFASCDSFEGEQEIPSYIHIQGFNVVESTTAGFTFIQDSSFLTNEITDVWVTVTYNGKQHSLGAYAIGETGTLNIPILFKGKCVVELSPGVKYNGMNATRDYYRFYTSALDTVELKEGEIIEMGIKDVSYNNSTRIAKRIFFEDTFNPFENALDIDSNIVCRMNMIDNKDSVVYGNKCGAFYSTSSTDDFKMITKDSIVGTGNKTMVLELDYHSNIAFQVGIFGRLSSVSQPMYVSSVQMAANDNPHLRANDKRNWQKMYITLGKVWANIDNQPFKLWFMPVNTNNNPKGYVHIDNIKLVTFPQ